jgi:hypothetical protein
VFTVESFFFAKYKPPIEDVEQVASSRRAEAAPAAPPLTSRLVRMLSGISLVVTATVLFLILKQGPPLAV